jgi:hypothetical protein
MNSKNKIKTRYCKNCKGTINLEEYDVHTATCLLPKSKLPKNEDRKNEEKKNITNKRKVQTVDL